jgi:hypothetical protein
MPTINGRGSFYLCTLNAFFLDGPRMFGKHFFLDGPRVFDKHLYCKVFVRIVIRSD